MKRSVTAMMVLMVSLLYAAFCQAQIVGSALLNVERRAHTATLLNDGKVLIVGGDNQNGMVGPADVFDPVANITSPGASLMTARTDHSATKLADGRVLIIGGRGQNGALTSTEIYDPMTATFSVGPLMTTPRSGHTATVLGDGKILVAGGDAAGSAELYDPLTQRFSLVTGSMITARRLHSAIVASTGQVLIVGGVNAQNAVLNTAEVYDPASQSFYLPPTDMQTPRALATLKLLADGKVQIIGGDADSTMEVFDPSLGLFNALALLPPTVDSLGATLSTQSRAALISPTISQDQFLQGVLTADHLALLDRGDHSITELPAQNKALVAGGISSSGQILNSATLVSSSSASITTDKTDYAPGSIVTIIGKGFQPNELVTIRLHETPDAYTDPLYEVQADAQGNFTAMQFSPQTIDIGKTFVVTAYGQTSGYTAQTAFTDGVPRIVSVSNSPFSPNQASSAGVKDTTVISARNQGSGTITDFRIRIHAGTVSGTLVREFLKGSVNGNNNPSDTTWDGKDGNGNVVADGTYVAVASNGTSENTTLNDVGTIIVDNTNPTVALSSPADNALVRGTISLEAIPLDAGGNDSHIDRVEFYVDAVLRGADSNSGGGWKTNVNTATLLSDGDHTWFAKAFDKAGNNATGSSRTLKVDNTPPAVTVVPMSNVFVGISKTITGTASDLPALAGYGVAIVQVTIRRTSDNAVLATGPATNTGTNFSTWSFSYTPAEATNQSATASATDNAGNVGNSTVQNFTVNLQKATPVITFGAAPTPTFGGGNFTVSASTSNTDSSTVTYSQVSGPCALVSGATFSSSGAGTCVVRASGVETANFLAASTDQSVTIEKASQAIVLGTPVDATFGTSFTAGITSSGASGNTVVFTSAGGCSNVGALYTMTSGTTACSVIGNQAGNDDYGAAPQVTNNVTALKASQAIVLGTPVDATFGTSFTAGITSSGASGNTVVFTSAGGCSNVGALYTMTSGTTACSVIGNQAGNDDYGAAPQVTNNVTALKASQAIVLGTPVDATFGTSFTAGITSSGASGNTVVFTSAGGCSNVGALYTMTSGTTACSVIGNQAGNDDYGAAPQVTNNVTALKASQAIVLGTPVDATFGTSFTAGITSSGASGNTVVFTSAGGCSNVGALYTMTSGTTACSVIGNQAGNDDYSAAPQVTNNVTALKASQAINVTMAAPATAIINTSFNVDATGGGSGYPVIFSSAGACTNVGANFTMSSSVGICAVKYNQSGNANYNPAPEVTQYTNVIFNFTGFFRPIDNLPIVNKVNAGSSVPIKFSLNGYQGMSIFGSGYPGSVAMACGSAPSDYVEEVSTPGSSGLTYDPGTDQYNYVWKTEKSWSNTCRRLVVKLSDGQAYYADFSFKK